MDALPRCHNEIIYEPAIHMRPSSRSCDLQESSRRTDALAGCLQISEEFLRSICQYPTRADRRNAARGHSIHVLCGRDGKSHPASQRLRLDGEPGASDARLGGCVSDFEQPADQVAQIAGRRRRLDNGVDESVLLCYSVKIKWIRQWYLAKVAAESRPSASSNTQPMGFDRISAADDSGLLPVQLDDGFWNALLTSTGPNAWGES